MSGIVSVTLLSSALWSAPPPPAAEESPSIEFGETVDVNVINVDVFVADRSGRPVVGLRKGDFELFEDGKPVEISNFQEMQPAAQEGGPAPTVAAAPAAGSPEAEGASVAAAAEGSSSIAIYFDSANTKPAHRARLLQQVRAFLDQSVRPTDRVMVASFDLGLHIEVPFTSDRVLLNRALDRVATRPALGGELDRARTSALSSMMDLQRVDPCSVAIKSQVESFAQNARQEALRALKGMTVLINSLSGIPGRKSLFLVSDGIPTTPGEELNEVFLQLCGVANAPSGISTGGAADDKRTDANELGAGSLSPLDAQRYSIVSELDKLASHAGANRVAIYGVQATGATGSASSSAELGPDTALLRAPTVEQTMMQNYEGVFTALASATGGKAIFHANDITQDMNDAWRELSARYSLGFSPPRRPDGRQHRLEVKVKRSGVRVRSPQSYRDRSLTERTIDRTLATLLYGLEDNPLEVQVEVDEGVPGGDGNFNVPVRLRIPLFKLGLLRQETQYAGKLSLLVASQTSDGVLTPVRRVQVPLNIAEQEVLRAFGQYYVYNLTLQLKEGEQRVAIGVRDEVTGTASFLAQKLRVGSAVAAAQP